ncbi:unnamed protein product [Urochloa humidicola]
MFYRVRLVLDGVPRHAWQPDIVERLIGRTCALQCIDTNLLHPVDTRGIELWAWTADPSRIPKVMWLIFTTGTLEGSSSSVQISEIPPSRWQRGINHPVLIHIWEVHNYSSVTTDPQEPDVAIGKPERRRLPWFWGVKDGDQEPTPAFPPLGHPPPPRVTGRRDERQEADRRNREHRDRAEAERRARGEHHPDFHDLRGRHRDDHQDDCDRDRWGRNLRRYGCGRDAYGARRDVPRRERSRSPRRREAGHGYNGGRRRPESPTANDIEEGRKNNLKVAAMKDASSSVFNLQGKVPSASATPCSPLQMFRNISRLAEQEGNEPWSNYTSNKQNKLLQARMHTTVPVRRAYYKIKNALPIVNAPSIQEVDDALSKLAHAIQPGEEQVQPAPEPVTPIRTPTESEPTTPADAEMATINTATPTSAQVCTPTTPDAVLGEHLSGVADLFITPEPGILAQPPLVPGKKGRRLKKPAVTVSSLCRSKRQAASRLNNMPAEQRANYVLCRRLGYIKDDLTPAERAIQEFVASFKGPMPQDTVAALTAIFRLDDDDMRNATEALVRIGGQEAADGLPELNEAA